MKSGGDNLLISACGVMCSACPAYLGHIKGDAHQEQTAEAWQRIYGLSETPKNITCGGCLGADEDLFYTSRKCVARQCCLAKGFDSCAECPEQDCADFKKAQSVWDEVPGLITRLSPADFEMYARAYCDHRKRLEAARNTFRGV